MSSPKRNRARILTASGLKKLREQMRSHEVEENAGFKYTLERLGELTGLDPETVKNVLDCKGSDKRTIARCFETFGLTLEESDHIPAVQATADPNFVGRDEAIADLDTLVSRNARVIVIQARGGVGKTTLARKYLQQAFGSFLEFPIAKETKDIASIEGLLEEKLRQLGEEPGQEFLVSLDRLKRKLQAERIGILIDNLEPALDSAGKFIEAHRRYVELLRVLSDPTVQSMTLITSRERLREVDITVQHYPLRSLDIHAWEQFFQSRNINVEPPALASLHDAYGGNAKAMDIISGTVLEDFSGNVEAYWQANQNDLFIEQDLEDLVKKQFDRLNKLDPDAYTLLCRMGCYRYQDVATVPIEGLFCLLWDVPENRHRRVIKSLQDRSLVDCEDREFWLHPVIKTEAIECLRGKSDYKLVHQKAAEFWTKKIDKIATIEDALVAFEAYYHCIDICDFEEAGRIIMIRRPNDWHDFVEGERLDGSFHRLGLIQQMHLALIKVVNNIDSETLLNGLFRSLARSFRFTGNISESIKYCKQAIALAKRIRTDCQDAYLIKDSIWSEAYSLVNLGVCQIELGEFEEAINYFEEVRKLSIDYMEPVANFYLALLYSHMNVKDKSLLFLEESYHGISTFKLNSWGRGDRFVSLGLGYRNIGNFTRAIEMYNEALSYSQDAKDSRIKAVALYGLASIDREMERFTDALKKHLEAIKILTNIGARYNLAEAYFQNGLTCQKMHEDRMSKENFQKAIQLFSEMEAPKQVERVRRSMQSSQ